MLGQNIRLGSLNVRSIFMESQKTTQKEFASYLRARSLGVDILCLQEVSHFYSQSSLTDHQIRSFSFFFPRCPFVVSKHCAIVCLKPGLSLDATQVLLDERCVVATVKDAQHNVLCRVANIYAPAQSSDRPLFIQSFLSLALWSEVSNTPWMLVGDFNIHLHSSAETSLSSVAPLYDWLRLHFNNCFPDGPTTFPRAGTTIDYIFGHTSLVTRLVNGQVHYVPGVWTDHCLLTIDLQPACARIGPGCWRFNPTLLEDSEFLLLLDKTVSLFFESSGGDGDNASSGGKGEPLRVQSQWESFKLLLKCCAQKYAWGAKARFKNKVAALQQERMKAVSSSVSGIMASDATPSIQPSDDSLPLQVVHELEKLIDGQIQKETRQNMLRSATRWHELGERNNKYFYRVIKDRQSQQTIQSLKCSTTGEVLVEAADILREARGFYQKLYTPDDIDAEAVDSLLNGIPEEVVLSSDDAKYLMALPNAVTVLDLLAHAPRSRSPGMDGIPFEVYHYLAGRSRPFLDLLVAVLGGAFSGVFPPSWQQTRMVLLFKKGDPLLLANWRPLSLINSDAKLFTKLLANRFNRVLPKLINPYQTGFLPHRLISDNGWLNQTLMANLRSVAPNLPQVAVLLDQEKAYDRVHPEYLRRVLLRFGFPSGLVGCLSSLFFGTKISVSINGWLGAAVPQLRGLRQGDPLSPLLFNLAFEPLLRSVLACSSLSGVSLAPVVVPRTWLPNPQKVHLDLGDDTGNYPLDFVSGSSPPAPIKLLSYADDLEVFLSSPGEWLVLLSLLEVYGRASNAKVNLSKTVLVSLSGVAHQPWVDIASAAGVEWHDSSSVGSVRYLGYPLYHTDAQLLHFLDGVKVKLERHANMLRERHLSIRGTGLVANSLLLSKVYHLLRVVPVPGKWLLDIKAVVRKYVASFWPAPSWSSLCLPRKYGGVGLVDIQDQSFALHLVYVQRLLRPLVSSDFVSPWLVFCFQAYSGHSSVLPWLMYPSRFKPRLNSIPTLDHLTKLLVRLPPLVVHSSWSSRWFLDLPLCCVVSSVPGVDHDLSPGFVPSSVAPKYLMSDIFHWNIHSGTLFSNKALPSSSQVKSVYYGLSPPFGPVSLALPPVMRSKVAFTYDEQRALPVSRSGASSWMPSTRHWTVPSGPSSVVSVVKLPLGVLRRFWHADHSVVSARPGPPLAVASHLLLRPFFWRLFWSLPMVAKAFTPWWRLLHDKIGYRSRVNRWSPQQFPSPFCVLCGANEDLYHFAVGCPHKSDYWRQALVFLSLDENFPCDANIWAALVTLCSLDCKPLDVDVLSILGSIFYTLWATHWRCVIHDDTWSSAWVLNSFKTDNSLVITTFLDSRTPDESTSTTLD
jgi:endonuclease/exonuclease/phosphatase family metal-dependent hydrolase